jgi:2-(1,2-epoxy-1,2-dihydrophenyl)acetyl-CoA isomerase
MSEKPLLIEQQDKTAVLTLNRPDSLNALSLDLVDLLIETCQELRNDDKVWAVVITGNGRGFCSGANVGMLQGGEGELPPMHERLDVYGWVGRLSAAIYKTIGKPVIGAINGVAAGAGMSVALACDMRVGSEKTRFKVVFPERSLSPDTGLSYFLPRIVGYGRACDLVMTSRFVEAEEAYRIGLLDRLVSSENLMDEALKLANQITLWAPLAIQTSKRVLQESMENVFDTQLRVETMGLKLSRQSPHDQKEQGDAFREKRKPRFTGF